MLNYLLIYKIIAKRKKIEQMEMENCGRSEK